MMLKLKANKLPEELACLIMKELEDKCKPVNTITLVGKRKSMNWVKIKSSEEPKKSFERLKAVKTRFNISNHKTSSEYLMVAVLSKSIEKYQVILTAEK